MALEILDEVKDLDAIIAPIGFFVHVAFIGITRCCRWRRNDFRNMYCCQRIESKDQNLCCRTERFAVLFVCNAEETKGADDAARSKEAGQLLPSVSPQTAADGL